MRNLQRRLALQEATVDQLSYDATPWETHSQRLLLDVYLFLSDTNAIAVADRPIPVRTSALQRIPTARGTAHVLNDKMGTIHLFHVFPDRITIRRKHIGAPLDERLTIPATRR